MHPRSLRDRLYFISRVKENMVYDWLESVLINRADPRNHGVTEDRRVMTRDGHPLRIIYYTDPRTAEEYEFVTNEPDLPTGSSWSFTDGVGKRRRSSIRSKTN